MIINMRNNHKNIRLLFLCVLIVIVVGIFCYKNDINIQSVIKTVSRHNNLSEEQNQKNFDLLTEQIFQEEALSDSVTLNYTVKDSTSLGLKDIEPTLGTVSMEDLKNGLFITENRLAALDDIDYDKLTDRQKFLYDILETMLHQNMKSSDVLEYAEYLGPTSGIQAQLPVLLAEYNFYTQKDIDTYIKLLELVPEYFDGIIQFEKQKSKDKLFMSDTTAQAIIRQCQEFVKDKEHHYLISVFNNRINEFTGLSEETRKAYKEMNQKAVLEKVIPAYEKLIDALVELKGSGVNENGLCGFDKGKEYYEYLVGARTGSGRSVKEINRMLEQALNQSQQKLASIMTERPDAYYKAQNIEYPYREPKKAIQHLKKAVKEDFPPLAEDINCKLKYGDKSLQKSMSPAFYMTSPIDDYKENVVYLNGYEQYDLSKAFTTIAHESYPGHLYQHCYFNSTNPEHIRSVINVGGYTEGWGTYAELYGYHLAGIPKHVADLLEQNTIATLCVYGKADIGVHYLGWDFEKLSEILSDYGFSKSQSRTVFDAVVAEPASYLQYTLGYLEIEDMLQEAKDKLGKNFYIQDFHKFFLEAGPAPFPVLRDRLDSWIESKQK